jgi:hypothetical protein
VPVVVLIGAALAVGLARKPTYTSESRLNVGGLNLTQQSIEGYVTAVQALALAYARAIDARDVVKSVSRKSGLSQSYVIDHVDATPILGSPVIRIQAKSKHRAEAVRLADAAADSLVSYAINLNAGRAESSRLLRRFLAASRALEDANAARDVAAKSNSKKLSALQSRASAADLKVRTLSFLYGQSQAGQANTELVQKLTPAGRPTSDRYSVLQDFVAGAALAGILIGIALAVTRANAEARRWHGGL